MYTAEGNIDFSPTSLFPLFGHEPDPERLDDDLIHNGERRTGYMSYMSPSTIPACGLYTGLTHTEGYGDVYKGSWLDRTIAVKTLRVHGTEENIARLNNCLSAEVNVWRRLQHRNILPTSYVVNQLSASATLTVKMISPWITNGNVRDYLVAFPDTNRRKLMTEVAEGMRYLHQSGVVHGALSPTNVLIDGVGRPLLSDFGLSAVLESNREPLLTLSVRQRMRFDGDKGLDNVYSTSPVTSSRPVCRYMAPELLSNERSYSTPASDVYMFACLCYESFVETPPFANFVTDVDVLLAIHRNEHPVRPRAGHPAELRGLDDFMWRLLESCWNSNPADRPNIHEVQESLQAANNKCDGMNASNVKDHVHDGLNLNVLAHL